MMKPITFTLLLTVAGLSSCLASREKKSSTPSFPMLQPDIPAYRSTACKQFMLEFVPVKYIQKKLNKMLDQYKEAQEVIACFNSKYSAEKVVNISQFKNGLRAYPEYQSYELLLNMLFNTDVIFDISYLHESSLRSFIIFFSEEVMQFTIPSEVIGIIQAFLKCLSYEKEVKFHAHYHNSPKICNQYWGIALLGNLLNTNAHFWMIHYKNKDNDDSFLPTSQLKVKVYEASKQHHHFFNQEIKTRTLSSFDLKNQFTFFEAKIFQNLCMISLAPKKYLFINSLGNRFQYNKNRIEYGIVSKNKFVKGQTGTGYFWREMASHHSQNKVHILGATCKGIALRTFDCQFNSFLPSQYRNNLMWNYSFYQVVTEQNNGYIWGLSSSKITNYHHGYQEHSAAILFDLRQEKSRLELLSQSKNAFSYLDTSDNLVAFCRYKERTFGLLDKRILSSRAVATYSLEKMICDCFIEKVHFLSDSRYLLAKCKDSSYLMDIRYATPVLDITNLSYDEEIFLKDSNLIARTNYELLNADLHYISIDDIH